MRDSLRDTFRRIKNAASRFLNGRWRPQDSPLVDIRIPLLADFLTTYSKAEKRIVNSPVVAFKCKTTPQARL